MYSRPGWPRLDEELYGLLAARRRRLGRGADGSHGSGACEGAERAVVVLPGGHVRRDAPARERLALSRILAARAARDGALVAAVCAAPAVALEPQGLLDARKAPGYPAPPFVDAIGARYVADVPFVRDGDLITSRGPGTSLQFALALVDALYGREKADELAAQMLVAYPA